jgi:hypothetical protein
MVVSPLRSEVISATPSQSLKVASPDADCPIAPRQAHGFDPRHFNGIMKRARRDRKLPGRSGPAKDKRTIRRCGFAAVQYPHGRRPPIRRGGLPTGNHVFQRQSI